MKNRWLRASTAVIVPLAAAALMSACAGLGARRRDAAAASAAAPPDMARVYELLKAGRSQDASGAIAELLRTDPRNRAAREELAYIAVRAKRWGEAIALFDALIDEEPENMRLRMERGYARQELGQRAEAADEFTLVAREENEFTAQAREALKGLAAEDTSEARGVRREALLNEGYDELHKGDAAAARAKFQSALDEDPGRPEVVKQLAYMSVAGGDLKDAVREFEGVRLLTPLDFETSLELGYLYDSLHDDAGAETSFAAAQGSPDPKLSSAAADALRNVRGRTDPFYFDVYASPYYSTRFSDKIAFAEAGAGWKPRPSGSFSAYLGTRYTQDSLSHGGGAPVIFSDNDASVEPGIRWQPRGCNVNLIAEWGLAFNLIRSAEHPNATEFDGRVVLADYHYWEGARGLFVDAGGSAGYYSRYRGNGIGYLQLRGGDKVWDDRRSQLSLYAPVNVYKDVNRDFYNNAVEIGVGAELQPLMRVNLKLRAEYLHGTYMGIVGRDPNPYGAHYDDVRLTLIYSGHFTRRPSDETPPSAPRRGYVW